MAPFFANPNLIQLSTSNAKQCRWIFMSLAGEEHYIGSVQFGFSSWCFTPSFTWIRCLENCAPLLLNIVHSSSCIRFCWSHCLGSLLSFLIVIATKFCSFFLFFISFPLHLWHYAQFLARFFFLLRASSFVDVSIFLQFILRTPRGKKPSTVFVLAQHHVALTRRNRLHAVCPNGIGTVAFVLFCSVCSIRVSVQLSRYFTSSLYRDGMAAVRPTEVPYACTESLSMCWYSMKMSI